MGKTQTAAGWHLHPLAFPVLSGLVLLTWASGFIGLRATVAEASVLTILFWRSLMSGLILLPFALMIGPRLTPRAMLQQAGLGVLGMYLYLGGFSFAIGLGVPTGLVALITDMLPLGVALLSGPLLGQPLGRRQWLGMGVGVIGVVLVSGEGIRLGDVSPWLLLLPLGGTMAFALSAVLQRRQPPAAVAVHQSVAIQCLTAAALFGLTALPFGGVVPPQSAAFVFGIGWLVLVATFGGYGFYYLCLKLYPASRITAVLYLSPPLAMIAAYLAFDEPLSPLMLAGSAVTLGGVWLAAGQSTPPAAKA